MNFLYSNSDCPMEPSEIFNATESTALRIWEVRLYISSLGNLRDNLKMFSPYSIAFCQIINFSNLNFIHYLKNTSLYLFFRLPASVFRLPSSGFRLPASVFRLPSSGFRLPASVFRLPASVFRLPSSGFQLRASNFRLPASDFLFCRNIFHYFNQQFPAFLCRRNLYHLCR